MLIGLVIYGRLQTLSGGYLYDRKLVGNLEQAGHQVEIISLPWQSYGRHLLHNLSPTLRRRLQTAPFDLLLQDELNHPSLFLLNHWLRPRVPYPIITIVHHLRSSEAHPPWQNHLYRLVERIYLRSSDGFICNSRTTWTAVRRLLPHTSPHVIAHPAGDRFQPAITPAEIESRARRPGPLRLLFVGNLIPRKGLHTLLDALARLSPETYNLTVVGDTAVDPAYTQTIRRRLTDRVTLLGRLSDAELAQQMRRRHLLVVPSSYEGFGIVYLEGMGFGLPAVAGTAGAAGEIIRHDVNGYLLPLSSHRSTDILARRIRRLHHHRDHLIRLGHAARRRFAGHPTWEESMTNARRFIEQFSAKRPSSG